MALPRPIVWLPLLPLAACAAPPAAEAWQRVQQERLLRLHAPRSLALPGPAGAQDPQSPGRRPAEAAARHLDQREPPAPGTGPRPIRPQPPLATVTASVGRGRVTARVAGTRLDDRAGTTVAQLGVETPAGSGLQLRLSSSDQDLFAGTAINDGQAPADAAARASGIELFPYLRFDPFPAAEVPLRAGLVVDRTSIEHRSAGVTREWLTLGPRLAAGPRLRLAGDGDQGLWLQGHVAVDAGISWFEESYRGGQDDDTTWRAAGELGGSLQAGSGRWLGELGYRLQRSRYGGTDTDLLGDRRGSDVLLEQWFLGLAVSF